jgi:malate/lactate dehydrogenase
MRVVITGATGNVGTSLAESILAQDKTAAEAINHHLKEIDIPMAELATLEEKLAEVTGLAQAAQATLVDWALPIQERHLNDVRSCSLRLAEAEAG